MTNENIGRLDEILAQARMMRTRGEYRKAKALLESKIDQVDDYGRAAVLHELAQVALHEGRWRDAHQQLDEALSALGENARENHWRLWMAISERKAWALFREGKLAQAKLIAEMLRGEIGERQDVRASTRADLFNTLGGIAWQESRINDAVRDTRRSAELYEAKRDYTGAAHAYTNLGVLHYTRGEWARACEELGHSENLRLQHAIMNGRASNLINLASIEMSMGDHESARAHLESAIALSRDLGEQYETARAEIALAHLDVLEQRLDEAWVHLDGATLSPELISQDDHVQASWLKSMIESARGSVDAGMKTASDALRAARESQCVESQGDCYRALAYAQRRSKKYEEAERMLREAITLADQTGDLYRRGLALLDLGEMYQEDGRSDPARRSVAEAAQLFATLGARFDLERAQKLAV